MLKGKVLKWIWKEFCSMLPVVIFFFIAFSLADLSQMILHKKASANYYSFLVVLVSALVMGKVVLISDHLRIIHLFSKKPLIYITLWKTCIYTLCSFIVRILDRVIPAFLEADSWEQIHEMLTAESAHIQFWLSQAWLFVLFLIFVAYRELISAVGKEKVYKIFFGK